MLLVAAFPSSRHPEPRPELSPRSWGDGGQLAVWDKNEGGTLAEMATCDDIGDFGVAFSLEDVRGRFESLRF